MRPARVRNYADEESDASNDEDGVWSEAGDDASESEPESPRATCDLSAAAVADEQPADAAGGATAVVASAEASEEAQRSAELIEVYGIAQAELKRVGAVRASVQMGNAILTEKRRMRARTRTDADVALALARLNDARAAEERKRRRLIDEAASRREALDKLNGEAAVAAKKLRASNKAIAEAEEVLEAKHALKSFTLEQLGAGKKNCGGAAGKKKRGDVLDRMARLGTGLSAPQRNDFAWFKDAWDTAMLVDHGAEWPRTFAEWMQRLLNDIPEGAGNAFSMFAHPETRRKFATEVALVVP